MIKEFSRRVLGNWLRLVEAHPALTAGIILLTTLGVFYYSVVNFRINTDINGMISEKLPFRRLEREFSKAFPNLSDTIVVVIDAENADLAISSRELIAKRLLNERKFKKIYTPGAGEFFEKNGLLYLSTAELEELGDNLAAAQPLVAFLSRDPSLRGLFSILGVALEQGPGMSNQKITSLYKEISAAFGNAAQGREYQVPWQELMMGEKETAAQRRQFIIIKPEISSGDIFAAETPLKIVRGVIRELGLEKKEGVKVRITGDLSLSYENLLTVRKSIGIATVASLFFVGFIIFMGLGSSARLFISSLLTLLTGLIWTTGFAMFFIGSVNLISVTFAVLFIGLGIDYGIQFCLRYRELMLKREEDSLRVTAQGIGRALLLSCIATALGFYSFLPTAYAGVAELGLISGTGMFISFFGTVTLLPALLSLFPFRARNALQKKAFSQYWRAKVRGRILELPYRHRKGIMFAASLFSLAGLLLLPRIYFDYNPLNLYDRKAESVSTIKDLFRDRESPPWTASTLMPDGERARKMARDLSGLKEVKMAVTLFDFVPQDQSEKLGIISNMSFFIPQDLSNMKIRNLSYEEDIKTLASFEKKIKKTIAFLGPETADLKDLYENIERFKNSFKDRAGGERAFENLSRILLSDLPSLFTRLERSLEASPVSVKNLPEDIVEQYLSNEGLYRVQIFPEEDLLNRVALEHFVKAVRGIAPLATDAPVTIYESGSVVISSFKKAAFFALFTILLVLFLETRSFYWTALILIPLLVSVLSTGAVSVLFNIPLNFANVIVVPLLIGIGVHNGILFIIRYKTEPPASCNMLETSTSRSILVSSFAAVVSTLSLSFSAHRGISSLGILLSVCFLFLMTTTLLLLPALIRTSEQQKIGKS